MIRITHFVNPHLFFFRHLSNDGSETSFQAMEKQLYSSVEQYRRSPPCFYEICIGDIVAVHWPFWNKWIRGQIKEIDENGLFYVWALDYGVPLVSTFTQIIKLQPDKIHSNVKRIHVGGLINYLPAANQRNWSPESTKMVQEAIRSSTALKFDNAEEVNFIHRTHYFGRLLYQKSGEETWFDLGKLICDKMVAQRAVDINSWAITVSQIDSIHQPEWKTVDGTPLEIDFIISPAKLTFHISNENSQPTETSDANASLDETQPSFRYLKVHKPPMEMTASIKLRRVDIMDFNVPAKFGEQMSRKGNRVLINEGYRYNRSRVGRHSTRWICWKAHCTACAHTKMINGVLLANFPPQTRHRFGLDCRCKNSE